MTLDEEAKQLHAEVAAFDPGRGRRCTLRERVLTVMERAQENGMFETEASKLCRVPLARIDAWLTAERHAEPTVAAGSHERLKI